MNTVWRFCVLSPVFVLVFLGCASTTGDRRPAGELEPYQHDQRLLVGVLPVEAETLMRERHGEASAAVETDPEALSERESHSDRELGGRLAALLTDRSRYRVIEQQRISDILEQQELQALSGIVDSGTAQEIGNLIGARALVMASIDRLRYDEDRTSAGIAWIDSQNVELEMSARIVLVETGELVTSADVAVSRGRRHWVAFGFLRTGGLIERFDLEDEALSLGLDHLAYELSQRAPSY